MPADFHDILIENDSVHGRSGKISLDGEELRGVQSITVKMTAQDVTLVQVELVTDSLKLNFPAALEVMVALQQEGLISLVPEELGESGEEAGADAEA